MTKLTVNMDSNLVYDPNLGAAAPNFASAEVSGVTGAGSTKLSADQYTVDLGGFDATKPGTYTVTYTYKENTNIKTTVTVTVLSRKVNITVKNEGKGGTADHLGKNTVDLGSAMTLTATLESDEYEFLGWYLSDGTKLSSELVYTFNAETNMTITAKFKLDNAAFVTVQAVRDFELIHSAAIYINGVRAGTSNVEYLLGEFLDKLHYESGRLRISFDGDGGNYLSDKLLERLRSFIRTVGTEVPYICFYPGRNADKTVFAALASVMS
jgi:hypothetical protein